MRSPLVVFRTRSPDRPKGNKLRNKLLARSLVANPPLDRVSQPCDAHVLRCTRIPDGNCPATVEADRQPPDRKLG